MMNAITTNWVSIGTLHDVPRRGSRCVKAGEITIAIFRTLEDKIYALEDKCPHKAGPLSNGIVHDGCVTCPLHNWVISLETGEAQGADEGATAAYPIKMDGDTILIDIGAVT